MDFIFDKKVLVGDYDILFLMEDFLLRYYGNN